MNFEKSYKEIIEEFIFEYPICEFYYLDVKDIIFSEEVRFMCENETRRDNQSWVYLPAIQSIEECKEKVRAFEHAFIFTTVTEVRDSLDFLCCLDAKKGHEQLSYNVQESFRRSFGDVLTLTTGCGICDKCAYPDETCRHPDKSFSTIEGHGIYIMKSIEETGISYDYGNNVATYISLIFFNA